MKRPTRTCVKCGASLRYSEIMPAGPFPCRVCHAQLQASESYTQWTGWGSILVATLVFAALGFRGLYLLCAVLVASVPVVYVAANFLKYLIPPKIETYLPKNTTLDLRGGPPS